MTERLNIVRLAHRGDGVADTTAGPLFVPYTLPGEIVEVERVPGHLDRRHLLRVLEPSPDRVSPVCPHFGVCGGCAVQHWTEPKYREWKRDLIVSALAQAGLDVPVDALIDAHGDGRRRATFHARRGQRDVIEVGFAALRAHHIVGIDRCPVLTRALDGAIATAWAIAETLRPQKKPLDIQATATEGGIDIDVRGSGALPATTMSALARVADKHRLARLTRHGELVVLRAPPTVLIGRARLMLPPGPFLQATAQGETALAERVIAHLDGSKAAADLFCGLGPFALRLAERMRVRAIDSDAAAIAAIRQAAANIQGLKPIQAEARDLFRRPLAPAEMKGLDAVVFDPPRQGAEAQSRELAKGAVPLIVAVSCNPSTFARDAQILVDGGYRLAAVTPIDQFRHSAHVEIVARFER